MIWVACKLGIIQEIRLPQGNFFNPFSFKRLGIIFILEIYDRRASIPLSALRILKQFITETKSRSRPTPAAPAIPMKCFSPALRRTSEPQSPHRTTTANTLQDLLTTASPICFPQRDRLGLGVWLLATATSAYSCHVVGDIEEFWVQNLKNCWLKYFSGSSSSRFPKLSPDQSSYHPPLFSKSSHHQTSNTWSISISP